MLYLTLKTIHIIAATLFFGTGLGSAFFKIRADMEGDVRNIVFAQNNIVLADWLFTVPSGLLLPMTGIWMATITSTPLTQGWVGWGILLYSFAGICWVPAAVLQIKMHKAAIHAEQTKEKLPPAYYRWSRIWFLLGVPAFGASILAIYIMVAKHWPF